jgi:inorganic pyrophosphatase
LASGYVFGKKTQVLTNAFFVMKINDNKGVTMLKIKICFLSFLLLLPSPFVYATNSSNANIYNQNYIDEYPPINEDGTINAVIEIPAGTNEKWEVTKPDGKLELNHKNGNPRIIKYLGCPGNYGMIPRTLLSETIGGDGDPLDVLFIGAPVMRGKVIKGKLIGVLKFSDKGEKDDKLLAVLPKTVFYDIDNISQLDETFPGITSIIKTWFLYYKGSGKMIFKGFGTVQEARAILNIAIKEYRMNKNKN